MLAVLHHRGPDGLGVVEYPGCVLGNTRLKVTDLSPKADLPLASKDGTVWLAYNGAVTNFRELKRSRRMEETHRFRSDSDTEVVLHLYEDLGIDFLGSLSGMFAFCLYDGVRQKAYLVRDFFGQRPLFYRVKAGRLHFASEIKAFLELDDFDGRLDLDGLHDFFSLAYIPGHRTPFQEVRELEGGHLLEVDLHRGVFEERRYYQLRFRADEGRSRKETARQLHDALLDSTRRNLQVDVPVGLTLSGGVDSGCLLGLLKELGVSSKTHTFSIAMGVPSFDESRYQRILASFGQTQHHEVSIHAREVLENLPSHLAYLDEPSGDGATIPFFLLAREARKHVSVLLSGEGGDEIFNAYETHRAYKARKLYRNLAPPWLRGLLHAAARRLPVSHEKLSLDFVSKRFAEGAEMDVARAHFHWRHVLSEAEKRRLLPGVGARRPTEALFEEYFRELPYEDQLDRISAIDLRYYFVDDLMVKNDRMFMAHSVEGRYPYMDRHVVELAATIPTGDKMRGFKGRYIQKLAMKGLIPPEIQRRTSMGLELPHSTWLMNEIQGWAGGFFTKKRVERSGLLDFEAVDTLWREHASRRRDNGRALWCVASFMTWFDLFVHDGDYKRHLSR